ncbi:MAG TPA: 8-amino-7-oxononanoate synthase [Alcaligenes sp.]|nr:8-amino-7-oxononanoate synthase [Alcaligenes sp.]HRL27669.1 8-amino-7-oxononanoate synthase [Alcaligenes sp.]
MNALLNRLEHGLQGLRQQDLWRHRTLCQPLPNGHVRRDGRDMLSFAGNDYLGLSLHPDLQPALADAAGATASPLVCGHHRQAQALEQELAAWSGFDAARLFVSGYQASLGVIPALLGPKDSIFCDRLNHASLIDGSRLSGARLRVYPHRDMGRLEALLSRPGPGLKLIISDSLFSMDGTLAPVDELLTLCERHDAMLYLDDAHGLGVLGANGRGAPEHFALTQAQRRRLIYLGTFGKAAGLGGAFVAGSATLIDWLTQRARSYVFSTGLAPAHCAALRACLPLISQAQQQRTRLQHLARLWQMQADTLPWPSPLSETPVQRLMLVQPSQALRLSAYLAEHGIWAPAIRPPTVPRGQSRLRISLSAAHQERDILRLADCLRQAPSFPNTETSAP